MKYPQTYGAAVLAVALITPFAFAQDKLPSRSTPWVQVIKKTVDGVVAIRVPSPNGERDMIGSGVLFQQDENGAAYIVTNRHVTGGKRHLKIRLNDGTDLSGEVMLTEPDLDLAIVKFTSSKKLTILRFSPTDFQVGEEVIAIGSPFGYEATVSRGIISALNREIPMPNDVVMKGLIQHDAPINPGNSGGPLVNINGEVVGINVAMRDGAQNIAFTINSGTVKGFLHKYKQRINAVSHGLKYEEKVVAEVGDRQRVVIKNSVHAELKSGDEIRMVADCRVVNGFDVERALWSKKPGQQVEVRVSRAGKEVSVRLTLEASQGAGPVAAIATENHAAAAKVRTVKGQ